MGQHYRTNSSAVFSLKYHLVWCPKYRRPVLTGDIERRLMELIMEKAENIGVSVHTAEIMPDHVHLFVEADPTISPAEIAGRLKGHTSRILRSEFPSLRTRLPTLWSRSYYAGTVGAITEAAVRHYIESQKRTQS